VVTRKASSDTDERLFRGQAGYGDIARISQGYAHRLMDFDNAMRDHAASAPVKLKHHRLSGAVARGASRHAGTGEHQDLLGIYAAAA
jgi:hypothetical protein